MHFLFLFLARRDGVRSSLEELVVLFEMLAWFIQLQILPSCTKRAPWHKENEASIKGRCPGTRKNLS